MRRLIRWLRRLAWLFGAMLLVSIVLLVIAGDREQSGRTSAWVVIDAPAARVYEQLVSVPRLKEWTRVRELEVRPGPELQDGSTLRMVLEGGVELNGAVTAAEPPHRLSLILHYGEALEPGFTQLIRYRLEPAEPGTRLIVTGDAQYRGTAWRLFEPLITASGQRQLQSDLTRLKALVENASF